MKSGILNIFFCLENIRIQLLAIRVSVGCFTLSVESYKHLLLFPPGIFYLLGKKMFFENFIQCVHIIVPLSLAFPKSLPPPPKIQNWVIPADQVQLPGATF